MKKNNISNIEILAPAGDFDSLKAAINGNCDAIYLGGNLFSARAFAKNFSNEELEKAVDYAHVKDVRIFVTINTLIKDTEIIDCLNYISFLYKIGVDAIIIQDIGLLTLIRKYFTDLPIHLSTQANVGSIYDIKELSNLNIQRVILPRELNIDEIKEIVEFSNNLNIEIEVFVHGALCVSYSGKCLFSALNGGRSANRGECAQICRKKYDLIVDDKKVNLNNQSYILSMKDLNTLQDLEKIVHTGVKSLKIEGRMKKPEYVYATSNSYKTIILEILKKTNNNELNKYKEIGNENLKHVFNREFTKGYILNSKGKTLLNNEFQKPRGEKIGKVLNFDSKKKKLKIKLFENLKKGDGLSIGEKVGRIIKENNKICDFAEKGEVVFLDFTKKLETGLIIYRTSNVEFENLFNEKKNIDKKLPIILKLILKLGKTPKIEIKHKINISPINDLKNNVIEEITLNHEENYIIEKSINNSLTKKNIIEKINKLGNSSFYIEKVNIDMDMDENIFIPVKILNELRRNIIEKLEKEKINIYKRKSIEKINFEFNKEKFKIEKILNLFIEIKTIQHFHSINLLQTENMNLKINSIIIKDRNLYSEINKIINNNEKNVFSDKKIKIVYKSAPILNNNDYENCIKWLNDQENPKVLFSSYSFLGYENNYIADYSLNIYNTFSHKFYNDKNIYTIMSIENVYNHDEYKFLEILNKDKVIVPLYLYPNLMVTKFCPHKNDNGKCIYDYKCKLNNTYIKNEENDIFKFEKFSNCNVIIKKEQPFFLEKKVINLYKNNGYNNYYIELNENDNLITILNNLKIL